ncbi:MAG: IPT/TIG domain-containing protein [Deltaproteobacteria bacterium]|nr:IPT/TIG domain-containing protein [Deltaproteobacteria bacterium]
MVSKKIIRFLFILGACSLVSCSHPFDFEENIPTGATPFLKSSVNPTTLKLGSKVDLAGAGFSVVPEENVVSVGGITTSASAYKINESGSETITVEIPATAPTGETTLLVVVDGLPSNPMKVTVTP